MHLPSADPWVPITGAPALDHEAVLRDWDRTFPRVRYRFPESFQHCADPFAMISPPFNVGKRDVRFPRLCFPTSFGRHVQSKFPSPREAPLGLAWHYQMDTWPPSFRVEANRVLHRDAVKPPSKKGGRIIMINHVLLPPYETHRGLALLKLIVNTIKTIPAVPWIAKLRRTDRPGDPFVAFTWDEPPEQPSDPALAILGSWVMFRRIMDLDPTLTRRGTFTPIHRDCSVQKSPPQDDERYLLDWMRYADNHLAPLYQSLRIPESRIKQYALK